MREKAKELLGSFPHRKPRRGARFGEVGINHFGNQLFKRRRVCPLQHGTRLGWIAEQKVDFSRTEVTRIDLNPRATGARVDALLVHAGSAPDDLIAEACEGVLDELANRVGLAGRKHVIVWRRLL